MTPNSRDAPFNPAVLNIEDNSKDTNTSTVPSRSNLLIMTASLLNFLAYLLIGATVGISLLYALSGGLPLSSTPMHIVLCVIGYQLLMGIAILSLSPNDGWARFLSLRDKRRAHTILQIVGAGLAIFGSFVKIINKSTHWNTLHGMFGLVALVFTSVSLVNGLASLYAFELRRWLPGNLSKLTHICFGTVAFTTSSVCLCYGFDKGSFRAWATDAYTMTLIAFTGIFTFIIIINPIITFFNKSIRIISKNRN